MKEAVGDNRIVCQECKGFESKGTFSVKRKKGEQG